MRGGYETDADRESALGRILVWLPLEDVQRLAKPLARAQQAQEGMCRSRWWRQVATNVRAVPSDHRAKMLTFRVTFEGRDRVERVRAEAYRSVPPHVEFVVTEGRGLNIRDRVVATFDGRLIRRIATTG